MSANPRGQPEQLAPSRRGAEASVGVAFTAADRLLMAGAARRLAPHLPEVARRWTAQLPVERPEAQPGALKIIEAINLSILNGLFRYLAEQDIEGALRFYRDFHTRLISSQLDLPDPQQINIEQFFVSAQVAMPLLDALIGDLFSDDELAATRARLCFHKFWNYTLQSLGLTYSRLREAHLKSLRHKILEREQRLRVLYREAKHAEQDRRDSEQRFKQFMRNLPGGAFIKDAAGRYLYVNATISRVSKIDLKDWLGRTDQEIWPVAGAGQAVESDRQVLTRRKPIQLIETVPHDDGPHYWLVTKFPILGEGGEVAMIGGVSLDVTDQKRAEEELKKARDKALESARLKSAFLANMSHEIRTPLNIILGYSSLIAEHLAERRDQSQQRLLEAIERAGHRLIDTIHSILDLSKIETGVFELRRQSLRLAPIVERLSQDFRVRAKDKGLALLCGIEVPDAIVSFDEYCLRQALSNLLDNAIKFTEKGEVSARLYRTEGQAICVEVRDTGTGIEQAYLPRLFEPFSQEEFGYSRPYEGSGLGLALARRYLDLNGAALEVESRKGRGSVFTIVFAKAVTTQARQSQVESTTD